MSVRNELEMIAAIYARKSTDQGAVADESKSVTRQVEHARQYAESRGWTVDDRVIFIDDGISGAETRKLLAKERLLQLLKSGRAPFAVLVMQASDRLSRRDGDEAVGELKTIARAGVQIWFYADSSQFEWGTFAANTLAFLKAEFAAEERRKASQRTRETLARKARAGHVTGGRVFGYDNVRRDSHTERVINEAEAVVVRRIFQMAVDGIGQKRIAQRLNAERALSPRPQLGRPHAWAVSSVHAVLFRPLYRGQIVYNRTKQRNELGEAQHIDRPADEWITVDAPPLRILSDELWAAAHDRIATSRAHHQVGTANAKPGRPTMTRPRFLLTGFARCSCCTGGLHVRSQQGGSPGQRVRARFYACTTHYTRGADVCSNNLNVRIETVDQAVIESIGEILTPSLADEVIAEVRELLKAHQADPRASIDAEIAAIATQVGNLTEAVAMGGNLPALLARLQQAEDLRRRLVQQRETMPAGLGLDRFDWRFLEREARQTLASWRTLATRHVVEARELLGVLLHGPIVFTPFHEGSARGYRFRGQLEIGRMLHGVVDVVRGICTPGSTALRLASPSIQSWKQVAAFVESMRRLRDSTSFAP